MSSFIRHNTIKRRTTGINILDKLMSTIEDGTMILVKEDEYSYMHNYLLNTFISEGVYNKEESILAISKDGPIEVYNTINSDIKEQMSRMSIAWRYTDLSKIQDTSKFVLTDFIDSPQVKRMTGDFSTQNIFSALSETSKNRVAIFSLFSPLYEIQNIERYLYDLKKVVRLNNHIAMISIPCFFYEEVVFNQFFDIVISLSSNIFTGILPNYKAVMHIEKANHLTRFYENTMDTFKFGMYFSRNRLVIEKINIPPEDTISYIGEVTPSPGKVNVKKDKLDF